MTELSPEERAELEALRALKAAREREELENLRAQLSPTADRLCDTTPNQEYLHSQGSDAGTKSVLTSAHQAVTSDKIETVRRKAQSVEDKAHGAPDELDASVRMPQRNDDQHLAMSARVHREEELSTGREGETHIGSHHTSPSSVPPMPLKQKIILVVIFLLFLAGVYYISTNQGGV